MIPIEELKPIFVMWMIKRITLLMIPIEELKPGIMKLSRRPSSAFDDTY